VNPLCSLPPLCSNSGMTRQDQPSRRPFLSFSSVSLRLCGEFLTLLLLCQSAFAAVTGTVINKTTGKPQAGATVALNKLDPQMGFQPVDQTKSDAQGKFTINQEATGQTPYLIRTAYDGVTYNQMLPPGSQTTGLTIDVYNSSRQPEAAKVSKHMVLFEPSGGQMEINETYLIDNTGQTSWYDPDNGTLHFFLPAAARGQVKVDATAPGSLPIGALATKTGEADVFKLDFPVKPGETRFDLTYTVPYTEGQPYAGKIVTKDQNTYLIAPNGVTMNGEGLNDLGQEPKTQAHLYGFTGSDYKIELTGAEAATPADNGAAADDSAGPQIEQILPRIYDKTIPILAVALGILALGFALLYRAHDNAPAKESNERGRG